MLLINYLDEQTAGTSLIYYYKQARCF